MNISRYASMYVREEGPDILVITFHSSRYGFEKRLQFSTDHVVYNDMKKDTVIGIDKKSEVLITVDQSGGGHGDTPNTSAEVYIKNGDDICLFCSFYAWEVINDLRKTECYKLAEFIAEKLKASYGIEWSYKIGIDTPEKQKRFNNSVFWGILTLVITFIIIYYRLKYDMDHPR